MKSTVQEFLHELTALARAARANLGPMRPAALARLRTMRRLTGACLLIYAGALVHLMGLPPNEWWAFWAVGAKVMISAAPLLRF